MRILYVLACCLMIMGCDKINPSPQVIILQCPSAQETMKVVQPQPKTPLTKDSLSLVKEVFVAKCVKTHPSYSDCECAASAFISNINKSGIKFVEDLKPRAEEFAPNQEQLINCLSFSIEEQVIKPKPKTRPKLPPNTVWM